jgi:hypothetical protein
VLAAEESGRQYYVFGIYGGVEGAIVWPQRARIPASGLRGPSIAVESKQGGFQFSIFDLGFRIGGGVRIFWILEFLGAKGLT